MKINKVLIGMFVIISLLIISTISMNVSAIGVDDGVVLVYRDTGILISNDSEFETSDGVSSGIGTASDPYMIENWEIDGISAMWGIVIYDTTKYCIIRNCEIYSCRNTIGEGASIYTKEAPNIIIENCIIKDNDIGINIEETYNITVRNCYFTLNGFTGGGGNGGIEFTGIIIDDSEFITIQNNEFYDEKTTSIYSIYSENCVIKDNIINVSGEVGIHIATSEYFEIIGNCVISSQDDGIFIHNSYNCTIIENIITENNYYGISLSGESNYNLIYHNNLFNNTSPQAWQQSTTGDNNLWDNGEEGNYWGDYNGTDADGDGIGDIPYDIRSAFDIEGQDMYPLMTPYTIPEPTWADSILLLLIGILPFIIIILLFKSIFKTMNKEVKK